MLLLSVGILGRSASLARPAAGTLSAPLDDAAHGASVLADNGRDKEVSKEQRADADLALRIAMKAGKLAGIVIAIHANANVASLDVLDKARALRAGIRKDMREGNLQKAVEPLSPAAADAGLREAMEDRKLDGLMDAIHSNGPAASPEVLKAAKAVRDELRGAKQKHAAAGQKTETPVVPASSAIDADAALHAAMSARNLDGLMDAIHGNSDAASPEVLADAKDLRDELRDSKHAAVKFVIVAASPRSASTAVAEEVADHRCSISFNEMFNSRPGDLYHPQGMAARARGCIYPEGSPCAGLTGGCNTRWFHQRSYHMLNALNLTRNGWCGRPNKTSDSSPAAACNGKCVVAVKMFGPDNFRNEASRNLFDSYAASFEELIAYKGTRVVIVERDAADDECSYNYSRASNRWHGGNKAVEHAWKALNCHQEPSPEFESAHSQWYAWIREKAKKHSKNALELPFEAYIANPLAARQSLHALAELPAGPEFEQVGCLHTPTLHEHLEQSQNRTKTRRGGRDPWFSEV